MVSGPQQLMNGWSLYGGIPGDERPQYGRVEICVGLRTGPVNQLDLSNRPKGETYGNLGRASLEPCLPGISAGRPAFVVGHPVGLLP